MVYSLRVGSKGPALVRFHIIKKNKISHTDVYDFSCILLFMHYIIYNEENISV